MAAQEYMYVISWTQPGDFQVGLCLNLHLKSSKESGVRYL